jgi:hypothetical protein
MMHQAALLDGAALDALAPQQNRLHPAELDTSRGRVIQAFILSPMSIPEGPRRDIRAIRQNAGMTHFRPRRLVGFEMKIHLGLEAKHETAAKQVSVVRSLVWLYRENKPSSPADPWDEGHISGLF